MNPTDEQVAAIDAFNTRDNLTIEAGAGTGKTSTLKMISAGAPNRSLLYVAYNAAIAAESKASFPPNCECRTAHSLAFRAVASLWGQKLRARLNAPRMSARDTALILGAHNGVHIKIGHGEFVSFTPQRVASIAMQTVRQFCYTGDLEIADHHMPTILRLDHPMARLELLSHVLPLAKKAWEDVSRPDGKLRMVHDHYLKTWAMSDPQLRYDAILVDEAQDSNGVVTAIVQAQQSQVVAVGDRCQAIYAWRGATDAMDAFDSKNHVYLTQSFRFGQAIADEANKWLELMDAKLRLTGNPDIESRIEKMAHPRAVLCRTNAEAIQTVMECHTAGVKVALVGEARELTSFARAARELMNDGRTSHPELFVFTSWDMVREYVSEAYDGSELAVLVRLVDDHSPEGIIKAIEGCQDESEAQVTVSTAHKAKGREWSTVRIAGDFDHGATSREDVGAEAMLAYVAVTRARDALDRTGLKWVDDILAEEVLPA